MTNKINISEKFERFNDLWNPRIISELNGQYVKIAKINGEFIWHNHEKEDELFMVIKGKLFLDFRDKTIELVPGELCVVPKGVDHRPRADEETQILMFEPASTINTGGMKDDNLTKENLDSI